MGRYSEKHKNPKVGKYQYEKQILQFYQGGVENCSCKTNLKRHLDISIDQEDFFWDLAKLVSHLSKFIANADLASYSFFANEAFLSFCKIWQVTNVHYHDKINTCTSKII